MRFNDDSEFVKVRIVKFKMIDLFLILLCKKKSDLSTQLDMLKIAPIRTNFIVALLSRRFNHKKDCLVRCNLLPWNVARVNLLAYTFFEGSLRTLLVDADAKFKMRINLIDFE